MSHAQQPAVTGHDQGVDLREVGIGLDEGEMKAAHHRREVLPQLCRNAEEEADAADLVLLEADEPVER